MRIRGVARVCALVGLLVVGAGMSASHAGPGLDLHPNGAGPVIASVEAEAAVAGAFLVSPRGDGEALDRAQALLDGSMFTRRDLGLVYTAAASLRLGGVQPDPITVAEDLKARGQLDDAGGFDLLSELIDAVPSAANVEYHAKIVRQKAAARTYRAALRTALRDIEAGERPLAELLGAQRERIEALQRTDGIGSSFPAPESASAILRQPAEEEGWLADGVIPAAGNVIIAGYPKSMKTLGYMDLAVAAALGDSWLHHFKTQAPRHVGLVLMEGRKRHAAHKLERLALSRGKRAQDLDERLHVWHRPPLRFTDRAAMAGLTAWAKDLSLDLLVVDAWGYVAGPGTNSNQDDQVLEQLQAFSAIRDSVPGLTTLIVHHARKDQSDRNGDRLTDFIRGSGAFGQWFDAGFVFFRKNEETPVTVRCEFREGTALPPFAFTAEDQEPASASNGHAGQGWFRLKVSEERPRKLEQRQRAEGLQEAVTDFLRDHPGASLRQIRSGVEGASSDIDTAVDLLKQSAKIMVELADGPGKATRHFLAGGYRA